MPTTAKAKPASHAVNLRVRTDARAVIDRAARSTGKTRTEFILEAASRAAEEALLDQVYVKVDASAFDFYSVVLDKPASGEGYARLMSAPLPWRP